MKTNFKVIIDKPVIKPLAALLLMIGVMAVLSDNLATSDNFFNVLRQVSVNLCISVGMTMVILTGGIDLSVGSILALSGAVAAGLSKNGFCLPAADLYVGFTFWGSILAALLIGGLLGAFNGWMITRLKVPPLSQLGYVNHSQRADHVVYQSFPITGLNESFSFLGTGWFLGVPMPCG
jgi:ribose transport system permease protein